MSEQVDAVVGRLAVRERLRWGRARFGRRTGALILQIEGDDDGRWQARCVDNCRGVLPIGVAGALTPDADEEQQIVALLRAMTDGCGFEGRPPYALPVVFPRFAAARTALYSWRPGEGQNEHEQLSDLMRTIKEAVAQAKRLTLPTARRQVDAALSGPSVGALFNGLVGAVMDVVHVLRFPHRPALRWFRNSVRFQNARTDAMTCRALWEGWAKWGPEQKQELLVEALLADVEAHYGFWRRLNRVRRPVFFLPDVDTHSARRAVRDRFLAAYDGDSRELHAYPVVITTARPDAAVPVSGARPAVPPDRLASEIPARFQERERVAEWRGRGVDESLPSRLVRVALEAAPGSRATAADSVASGSALPGTPAPGSAVSESLASRAAVSESAASGSRS